MMEPVCGGTDGKWLISELMHSGFVFQCEASVCDACLAHVAGPLAHAAGRTGADATDGTDLKDTWGFYVSTG